MFLLLVVRFTHLILHAEFSEEPKLACAVVVTEISAHHARIPHEHFRPLCARVHDRS